MRVLPRFSCFLIASLCATISSPDAEAFTPSLAITERTQVYSTGPNSMPPYGARLHSEVMKEIRRNAMPFRLIAPAQVVVRFAVNRRGGLVLVMIDKKSRSKLIDDYVETMIRQASRRFPAPPPDMKAEFLAFAIPISLN